MEDIDHSEWEPALEELIHGQDVASELHHCLYSAHEDGDLASARAEMEDIDHCEWKPALEELIHGQDVASELHHCLYSEHDDGISASAGADLAGKLVESFTNTLSLLGYHGGAKSNGVSDLLSAKTTLSAPEWINCRIDRRGRYKRRKSCYSWSETTPVLIDDGHAWRKYGQKLIHNSDFPRSYFRCAYKFEPKCEATKQVQRISGDPPLYQTTYYGHHTCKNTLSSPQLVFEDSHDEEGTSSNLVCFGRNAPINARDNPFFSSASFSKSSQDGYGTYGCNEMINEHL